MGKKQKTLIIILVAIFLVSSGFLVMNFIPKKNKYDEYKTSYTNSAQEGLGGFSEKNEYPDNPINFTKLKGQNEEVVGWIQIPNTVIDYPIMQSGFNTEEDFYLNRNLEKQKATEGSIYIQKMNYSNFTHKNTVVYGHDMRNGSMFGSLKKFRNAEYFEENDTIYIYVQGHILKYKIYSAFVHDDSHILYSFDFENTEEYQKFIDMTLNPKTKVKNVREGVKVTTDDRIITLSTCTNKDTERYLVVAVLEEDTYTN